MSRCKGGMESPESVKTHGWLVLRSRTSPDAALRLSPRYKRMPVRGKSLNGSGFLFVDMSLLLVCAT